MSDDRQRRGPSLRGIPEGDNRERMICAECGYVLYDNPKIVVGSVTRWEERILLVRRSIEPQYGYWTLPALSAKPGRRQGRGSRSKVCSRSMTFRVSVRCS